MAPQFNLQEELQQIANPQDYIITNEIDATDDDALAAALERAAISHLALNYDGAHSKTPYRCGRGHRSYSRECTRV